MTDTFLDDQRGVLERELETRRARAAELREEAEGLASAGEAEVQFDEESSEADPTAVAREEARRLAQQHEDVAEEARRALERLDAGTYGVCEACGERIARERLEAIPTATLCVTCKARRY